MTEIDPYRVTLRVRNNVLLTAIEEKHATVAAFCRDSNLSQTRVGEYLNLKRSPISGGEWEEYVVRVADALGVLPEEIFPPDTWMALKQNQASFAVGRQEIVALMESDMRPDVLYEQAELKGLVKKTVSKLDRKTQVVLAMRYGLDGNDPQSLEQIATKFGVTRERIRQIEQRGLRILRAPKHSRLLSAFLPGFGEWDATPP